MSLDIQNWKDFKIDDLFTIKRGFYSKKPMHSINGSIRFLGATQSNNGVTDHYSLDDIKMWGRNGNIDNSLNNKIFNENCIAVTTNGSILYAYYQNKKFTCSSDVTILYPKQFQLNYITANFFCTIIMKNQFKWNYARKAQNNDKLGATLLKLPVCTDSEGKLIIDSERKYSDNGYIPDFDYIQNYMQELHYKTLSTSVKSENAPGIETTEWENFYLYKVFNIQRGNGIDSEQTTDNLPQYDYITRSGDNNGVKKKIDAIEDKNPFDAKSITLALGGTLGSCFLQKHDFYTGEHMAVLSAKEDISDLAKLFVITIIEYECRIKYCAYARELDTHIDHDFVLKLPVKKENGHKYIDNTRQYSDCGFVPDWTWMENYMKTLSYSDKIV